MRKYKFITAYIHNAYANASTTCTYNPTNPASIQHSGWAAIDAVSMKSTRKWARNVDIVCSVTVDAVRNKDQLQCWSLQWTERRKKLNMHPKETTDGRWSSTWGNMEGKTCWRETTGRTRVEATWSHRRHATSTRGDLAPQAGGHPQQEGRKEKGGRNKRKWEQNVPDIAPKSKSSTSKPSLYPDSPA